MAGSKKEREDGVTYYDMLKWVDLQIEVQPLSLGELGLLFYILQSCNKNFSVECALNLRVVSAKTLAEVRRLPNKLKELEGKGYIKAEEISANIWNVRVNVPGKSAANARQKFGESMAKVRRLPGKSLAFADGEQGVEPIVATRQDKIRQDKIIIKKKFEKKILNLGIDDNVDDNGNGNLGNGNERVALTNNHPTPDQPPPNEKERKFYGDVELSEDARKFGFGG